MYLSIYLIYYEAGNFSGEGTPQVQVQYNIKVGKVESQGYRTSSHPHLDYISNILILANTYLGVSMSQELSKY